MITGDNARTAKAVACQVGIDRVLAEVLPQTRPARSGPFRGRDLRGLVTTITLSRATMRNIRQNLFLGLWLRRGRDPAGHGLLYPFTGDLLSPVVASAAMALSSISVVLNAAPEPL